MQDLLRPKDQVDAYLRSVDDDRLDKMIDLAVAMPGHIKAAHPPATAGQMLNLLADFADYLQVKAPGDAGIEIYVQALSDVPFEFLKLASGRLAKVHKYSRLPLAADFRAQADEEMGQVERLIASWTTAAARLINTRTRRKANAK